ncbi:MAG TPA: alpha/beta hydrolase [Alphaproteobacteria bacterium]|nr:alpha/beta hydrolase [Alphaproteobacteria bacterium]
MNFRTSRRVRLAYRLSGTGPAVALFHCAGTSAAQWRTARTMLEPDHTMLTPDMVGFGRSEPWPDDTLSLDEEAGLLAELLEATTGPAHLVGHSFGATLALRLALRHPALCRSLLLYEPIPFGMLRQAGEMALYEEIAGIGRRFVALYEAGDAENAVKTFATYWTGEDGWQSLTPAARRAMVEAAAMLRLEFHAKEADAVRFEDHAAIGVPAKLVAGEASGPVSHRIAQALAAAIPGAELVRLPGNHMAPASDPVPFAQLLRAHLGHVVHQSAGDAG